MSEGRVGAWLQTASGRQFWPLDPRPEEICIEDVAHALANLCRFGGHSRSFYSVAQHSVIVSEEVPLEDALWGLLHDASEAYLVDLPRPIKWHLGLGELYRAAEDRVMRAVCARFGLPPAEPASVRLTDDRTLRAEQRDLMAPPPRPWVEGAEPIAQRIVPWSPREAHHRFLDRFFVLTEALRDQNEIEAIVRETRFGLPLSRSIEEAANRHAAQYAASRERLPDLRPGKNLHFVIYPEGDQVDEHGPEVDGYVTTGLYADGRLGEVFVRVGKPGNGSAAFDQWAIAFSVALQSGADSEGLCQKFVHQQFAPFGPTSVPGIPRCSSVVDLICRWLLQKYEVEAARRGAVAAARKVGGI